MALEREIYKALEQVVGAKNISEDPGVCETYRCAAAQSSAHYGPYDHRTPMPQAVLMPGSTEEVQGILRICNKYKLKFKASTTFWSSHGYITDDYSIQLDMRRMKSFSIDPKNMTMIVEPYVIAATAQAEAMKYGLTCNIPGVGCSSSMVANFSGWGGPGPSTAYTGAASDNCLGAEWVLPNGEILVTGSAGSGSGWFSDEGPGPAQRGIIRGPQGQRGEFGVCTRIAVKLSPWPGPTYLPSEGVSGVYRAKLPDNIRAYVLCFPDWQRWALAMMMLLDAEVVFAGHRQFSMFGCDIKAAMLEILTDPDKQLADIPALNELVQVKETVKSISIEMYVVVAGMTTEDMEWKNAAIDKILETFGGWKDKRCSESDMEEWLQTYFIRLGHKNLNYTICGSYEGHFGLKGSNLVYSAKICEEAFAIKKEWEQKDNFMAAVGGDVSMGGLSSMGGGGGPMLWEYFLHFDAHDKESIRKSREYITNVSAKFQEERNLGHDFCRSCANYRREDGYGYTQEQMNDMYKNSPLKTALVYQWKLREAVNPNRLNGSYYPTLDPAAVE